MLFRENPIKNFVEYLINIDPKTISDKDQKDMFMLLIIASIAIYLLDVMTPVELVFRALFFIPTIFAACLLKPQYSISLAGIVSFLHVEALSFSLIDGHGFNFPQNFVTTFLVYFFVAQLALLKRISN